LERGRLNLAEEKMPAAASDLQSVIASLREQDEPARLAEALCTLAELRARSADFDGAQGLLDEAAALRKKIMPAAHPALAAVQRQLTALTTTRRSTQQ
jgi:hypothetical protein